MTQEELTEAFPDDDISVATPQSLPSVVTDSETRRFLIEVGFPEQVVGCVFFKPLDVPLCTLREYRDPQHAPVEVSEHFVIGITDYHTICLDGVSGACSFVADEGDSRKIAAGRVGTFVHFAARLNQGISAFENVLTGAELDDLEERLIADFRQQDSAALAESEEIWRIVIKRCIAEILT